MYRNTHTELELSIDEELIRRIADHGRDKYPHEFGGLLLGRYSRNNKMVEIKDTVLPLKYESSRYHFERGSEGLNEILEMHYTATPSLIYVGEWHTHPDGPARPSGTDLKAMRELASDPAVLINNPVLLILEMRKKQFACEWYLFHNEQLLCYTLLENK